MYPRRLRSSSASQYVPAHARVEAAAAMRVNGERLAAAATGLLRCAVGGKCRFLGAALRRLVLDAHGAAAGPPSHRAGRRRRECASTATATSAIVVLPARTCNSEGDANVERKEKGGGGSTETSGDSGTTGIVLTPHACCWLVGDSEARSQAEEAAHTGGVSSTMAADSRLQARE
ncbi:hypothetical protein ON010_g18590 [Phytophthora cinnamomi]|nr:hypothetical protein ON010_g18590 [Phytophthora cinnamomi]